MKIKVGDKLPSSELFYLDQNNDVKKINILELCKINKTLLIFITKAKLKRVPKYTKYQIKIEMCIFRVTLT